MANRVLTQVKTLFNWAVAEDILTASPCAGLKPPAAETSRDRVFLADHELGAVWRACQGVHMATDWQGATVGRACQGVDMATDWQGATVRRRHGDVIRMLLLTGQRLRKVSEMRWSEIDLDAKTWSLFRERCKNGHAHVVPLSNQELVILKALKCAETAGLVFGVSGFSRAKKALDAAAKLSTP